jgi:hypothetical protein
MACSTSSGRRVGPGECRKRWPGMRGVVFMGCDGAARRLARGVGATARQPAAAFRSSSTKRGIALDTARRVQAAATFIVRLS